MSETPSLELIREQAAQWAIRLEDEVVTEQECEEFRAWVSNPAHEEAFLAQVAIGIIADEVRPAAHTPSLRLVTHESLTTANPRLATRATRWRRYAAIAAAGALVAIGAIWYFGSTTHSQSYVTATRELRKIVFEDGSIATLNTRSELLWIPSSHDRRVVLKRGEALFDVVPDRTRPFRVLVGDLDEIRVLGTQFNVYRKFDGTIVVSVLAGNVEIVHRDSEANVLWARHVNPNQEIQYRPIGLPVIRNTDTTRAVRWRDGELEIEDDALADVLAELGRYTDQRIALLPDPRMTRMHVGGVLSVRDIESSLAILEKRVPIRVTRDEKAGVYTLSYRDESLPESRTDSTAHE